MYVYVNVHVHARVHVNVRVCILVILILGADDVFVASRRAQSTAVVRVAGLTLAIVGLSDREPVHHHRCGQGTPRGCPLRCMGMIVCLISSSCVVWVGDFCAHPL